MVSNEILTYNMDDYDYTLPLELIALEPSKRRDESRLMVVHRNNKAIGHRKFRAVLDYIHREDVIVFNDTKVVPALLTGVKDTGGSVEILVMDPSKSHDPGGHQIECLLKASKKPKKGSRLLVTSPNYNASKVYLEVVEDLGDGRFLLSFPEDTNILTLLETYGQAPLPPYIRKSKKPTSLDLEWYQTVYAKKPGAVAAPTAGFHFTEDILANLKDMGVSIVFITLHVGYGTFAPVKVKDARNHKIHKEWCCIEREALKTIRSAKQNKRRIIAVGTTVTRVLEGIVSNIGSDMEEYDGYCDFFILPGYRFKYVDVLITNFHLPRSTLILLASAFAGRELILRAYKEAVAHQYRFYSYGDAMLIL